MSTPDDSPPDSSWDNRRLILASLAPRTQTRPARHGTGASDAPPSADNPPNAPAKAGLLRRGFRAGGRGLGAAGRQFNKRVPPNRRGRVAGLTAACVVVLVAGLAGVKALTTDLTPPPPTKPATVAQPTSSVTPLATETILTGVHAKDKCPKDANYADVNNAFDGDKDTAWVCTRVGNHDGQQIQVDFGRQVTITNIRLDGGFDSLAPDGTDQWSKHRIVTKLEVWFPTDLKRKPVTINTGGARDFRVIPGGLQPPATVSSLLLRVAETSDPPPPATPVTPTTESASPTNDITTVAISEIQFIGYDGASRPS